MLKSLEMYLQKVVNYIKPTKIEMDNSLLVQNLSKTNYFYITNDLEIEGFDDKNKLKLSEEFRNNNFFVNNPFENMWVELDKPLYLIDKKLVLRGFGIFEHNETQEFHVLAGLIYNGEVNIMPFNARFNWNTGFGDQAFKMISPNDKDFFMESCGRYLLAIRQIIDYINNRNIHYISNNENIKIRGRVGGVFTKFKYNPDHIIYVATEKTVKTNEDIAKRLIKKPDFAYEVMGHWRRLFGKSNLGKNRQGNYCVVGRTWVKEHVRGQGELKKRTRLVVERV